MKLHIGVGIIPLAGYLNIDPSVEAEGKVRADFRNIDQFVEDAEATEIIADKVCDHLRLGEMYEVIKGWVKKLRHGGTILVGGIDTFEVANQLATGNINIVEFNQLIYGDQTSVWGYKVGSATVKDLCQLFESLGLRILRARSNNCEMFVEGIRE